VCGFLLPGNYINRVHAWSIIKTNAIRHAQADCADGICIECSDWL